MPPSARWHRVHVGARPSPAPSPDPDERGPLRRTELAPRAGVPLVRAQPGFGAMSPHDIDGWKADAVEWLEANVPRRQGVSLRAHDVTPEQLAADRALQKAMHEAGYLGITLPIDYGGQGLT